MTAEKKLPAGAIANTARKAKRVEVAQKALESLGKTRARFTSKNQIYLYLADMVHAYEESLNLTTKKGPCSRSGMSSDPDIRLAVEVFWLMGEIADDSDFGRAKDAVATSKLLDKDLEISNLKYEKLEFERFLKEQVAETKRLSKYIETIRDSPHALEDKTTQEQDKDKIIEALCEVIFKIEVWAEDMLERQEDGTLNNLVENKPLVSNKLMREYHRRIPLKKLEEIQGSK